ncbi:MAG: L-glutamate gamma-semialdehyde dehydrogenase [Deltaproteobacteria bacterium]|nr:L-glutamate gamma-semialdehyde dehydrogenase [Deltaproteobacteria bacterium]
MAGAFRNEPFTNFRSAAMARQMNAAISRVAAEMGRECRCVIGGRPVTTAGKLLSLNPARPNEVVGIAQQCGKDEAETALAAAADAFGAVAGPAGWRHKTMQVRAGYLFRAAAVMRRRRFYLAAWLIYEIGKTWGEADAEVAEAIDFCEYYARQAIRLGTPQPLTRVAGERSALCYIPLGVGVVIPPWNFPLAILTGMAMSAVVAGNTVVLKPSSEAPIIAAKFMDVMMAIRLPPGVINLVTGPGALVGDILVQHPATRFVAFTGSKATGLHIVEFASKSQPGQPWIKRVIAEMGGKDAIIVDDEADLAAAVEGVVQSAYGFQGQKCSACSRAIVTAKVYEQFVQQLSERVRSVRVGQPTAADVHMGPVVSRAQFEKVREYIDVGRQEGRLLTGDPAQGGDGYFIPPTVFADVAPRARIAQEEIFGPVLAVIKAEDFADGIRIANDTEYGLTGAVYTRNPKKIALARRAFHVGNLYVNRKCTGALVGAHPFGGFNMSGTNAKAGGPDYLLHFLQVKTVSEKR